MRLTSYTDFSLRVLMYLSINTDRRPTIAEIATRFGVSKTHLMKVVHELGQAGLVETIRGKGGGLRLGRPAYAITVGEVVRRTEPDMALAACFDPEAPLCVIAPACRLKSRLAQAQAAFLSVLDGCTLAEIAGNRLDLRALLGAA